MDRATCGVIRSLALDKYGGGIETQSSSISVLSSRHTAMWDEGMTPEQCSRARFLLGWSRARLGAAANLGAHVIALYEKTGCVLPPASLAPKIDRVAAIQFALETAGVEFSNGNAPDVCLRRPIPR